MRPRVLPLSAILIVACSATPPPAAPPPAASHNVAQSRSTTLVDEGPAPGDDVDKLTERGWARWLRGARAEALADFAKVMTKEKAEYARLENIVGPGTAGNREVVLGGALGVLGTKSGLLVFRTATGEPMAWRSYSRDVSGMFALRDNADLIVTHDYGGELDVIELPTLRTRASYHLGSGMFGLALSDDHALLAYYSAEPKEGARLVELATGKERWSVQPSSQGDPASALLFAPDSASLAVLTAINTPRGPHYQELVVLRTSDGQSLFTTSVEIDNRQDGRIGPAQIPPPLHFVDGGASVDFLDPHGNRTKRVDTRTGKVRSSPARLRWNDEQPMPTSPPVPRLLEARVCHASDYVLPAEACTSK